MDTFLINFWLCFEAVYYLVLAVEESEELSDSFSKIKKLKTKKTEVKELMISKPFFNLFKKNMSDQGIA